MNEAGEMAVGDAFGDALRAHHRGDDGSHEIERDDGHVHTADAARYFGGADAWSPAEAAALGHAFGRVLDIGTGAGRVALSVAEQGLAVAAIDTSAGAIAVARQRGVTDAAVGTVYDVGDERVWDTFMLLGSNLGLLRDPREAKRFLRRLRSLAGPDAIIIGSSRNPLRTNDPAHLDYHRRNLMRGRPAGQVTIRVRFGRVVTPWFDYLYLAPDQLRNLIDGSGWSLSETFDERSDFWVAVLRTV